MNAAFRPELSLVVPFYNEEGNVDRLYREIREVIGGLNKECEFVFVNDGSQDRTGAVLDDIARADPRVRVVHLGKNQGQSGALSAGFQKAQGRVVVTLDGDGQNDPRYIPALLTKIEEGYAVVSGWRRHRAENYWWRIFPSMVANGLIARVSGVTVHDCGCCLKAYRCEVLDGLFLPRGMHRFLPVILPVPAEAITEVEVRNRARRSGKSHYGLGRVFAVARDLLPVRCIRKGARAALRRLRIAIVVVAAALLLLIWTGAPLRSFVQHTGLLASAGLLVYLVAAYRRLREFVRTQGRGSPASDGDRMAR